MSKPERRRLRSLQETQREDCMKWRSHTNWEAGGSAMWCDSRVSTQRHRCVINKQHITSITEMLLLVYKSQSGGADGDLVEYLEADAEQQNNKHIVKHFTHSHPRHQFCNSRHIWVMKYLFVQISHVYKTFHFHTKIGRIVIFTKKWHVGDAR